MILKKEDNTKYIALYERANENKKKAYAPYSNFKVGVSLITAQGMVFDGVNVENSSYGATICAEQNAISSAITAGFQNIEAIAIAGDKEKTLPCGICRQVMNEFNPDMKIVIGDGEDGIEIISLDEIFKRGFNLKEVIK